MTISILGCGWYGFALAKSLMACGYIVKGSTTSPDKLTLLDEAGIVPFQIDTAATPALSAEFFACDVLVIAVPPRIRQGEGQHYVPRLQRIVSAIQKTKVGKVIFISSTGVYADRNIEVNETTDPKPDTGAGKALLEAEQLFTDQTEFEAIVIRFGGLIGPGRDPGRFFAGKKDIPNGLAPINLIHLDDCIGITKAVLEQDKFGYIINAVAPHHPPKSVFYIKAAENAGLEAPEFIQELNEWKIVDGVVVGKELRYDYQVNDWYSWLGLKE